MPKELEFVGGKFPKPVKDALKERADAAGLSMNEYLERLFIKSLDKEGDGQFSETEFKELMQKEVDAKVQAAIQKMPAAASFPKPVKDALKERADAAGITIDDYLQRLVIQSLDTEGDGQFSEDEYKVLTEKEIDAKIQVAIQKQTAKAAEAEKPVYQVGDLPNYLSVREMGGLEVFLSPLLADDLNCAVMTAWEKTQDLKASKRDPEAVIFFETLADELRERATSKAKYNCKEDYFFELPDDIRGKLDTVIIDATNEVGERPTKERLYPLIADLLNDVSDQSYLDGRSFEMIFDRSEYFHLDNMLEYVNRQRKANGEESFKDLQSWLRFKIGEQLLESAQPSFWGGYKYPEAAKIGESFQASSVGKTKA